MRNIEEALQEHKQAVLDAGFPEESILGVFLYGSQNYDLAHENSDVDTKAIYIPTIEECIFEKEEVFRISSNIMKTFELLTTL